jgi:predicted  nucleic acid-binding Zn-ribbon protein
MSDNIEVDDYLSILLIDAQIEFLNMKKKIIQLDADLRKLQQRYRDQQMPVGIAPVSSEKSKLKCCIIL